MYSSTSFLPNSRFINEFAVIIPINPAPSAFVAKLKNRSKNGTASEYCLWHDRKKPPVFFVYGLILRCDVGRVADHDVILLAEVFSQQSGVLGVVDVSERVVAEQVLLTAAYHIWPRPVQERIPGSEVNREGRRIGQSSDVANPKRGDQQPKRAMATA